MQKQLSSNQKGRSRGNQADRKSFNPNEQRGIERFSERERQAALASLYANSVMNDRNSELKSEEPKRVFGHFDQDYFNLWNSDDTADHHHLDLDRLYEQNEWQEEHLDPMTEEEQDIDRWPIHPLSNEDDWEASKEPEAIDRMLDMQDISGAPERYEWRLSDNFDELDRVLLDDFEPVARALNLTNAQANRLVSLYTDRILPLLQSRQRDEQRSAYASWEAAVRDDPDIGQERFEHNLALARLAIDRYGSDELREILNETGMGNHPALIKCFIQMANALNIQPDKKPE